MRANIEKGTLCTEDRVTERPDRRSETGDTCPRGGGGGRNGDWGRSPVHAASPGDRAGRAAGAASGTHLGAVHKLRYAFFG